MNDISGSDRSIRHFEDLTVGEGGEYGPYVVSEEEIVEFASRWDAQWFHTDPEAARGSVYGGVIASGIHTLAIMTRLMVDGWMSQLANLGSPGLDAIDLPHPVRPGDELRLRTEVVELRASASHVDRGIMRFSITVINQEDRVVLRTGTVVFVARRLTSV